MNFPPPFFSRHAIERIKERFVIAPDALLEILKSGKGKRIGISARTNLIHRLLWSHFDGQLLVVIQDVVDGGVLTVLTRRQYELSYPENISVQRTRHVVNQMAHAGLAPKEMWEPGDKEEFVTVYGAFNTENRVRALGRWKGSVESIELARLGKCRLFWEWVGNEIVERGYCIERLDTITAKFTNGEYQVIPFEC